MVSIYGLVTDTATIGRILLLSGQDAYQVAIDRIADISRKAWNAIAHTFIHLQTPFCVLTHTGINLISIFCSFIVWWINHEPTFLAHATFYFPQASNLAKLHCLHFLRLCKQRPKFEEKLFFCLFFPILSAFFTHRLLTGREFVLFWHFKAACLVT